jgi:hypothetical protein
MVGLFQEKYQSLSLLSHTNVRDNVAGSLETTFLSEKNITIWNNYDILILLDLEIQVLLG